MDAIQSINYFSFQQSLTVKNAGKNPIQQIAQKKLPPKVEPLKWTRLAAIALGTLTLAIVAAKVFQLFSPQPEQPQPDVDQPPPNVELPQPKVEQPLTRTPVQISPETQKKIDQLFADIDTEHKQTYKTGKVDMIKIFHMKKEAADLGSSDAQYKLGSIYYPQHTPGLSEDALAKFRCEYMSKAFDQGFQNAEKAIFSMFADRYCDILTKDRFKWVEAQAENGSISALSTLAYLYKNGLKNASFQLEKNEEKGFKYAVLVAEKGDAYYQLYVGHHYLKGENGKREEGFRWIEKSANQNNRDALNHLGFLYAGGLKEGTFELPISDLKAFECFEKAAKFGSKDAKYNAGIFYENGRGVAKDLNAAFKYFHDCGRYLNFAPCQERTGHSYLHGLGVEKNIQQALEWLNKAAAQENLNALTSLRNLYREGKQVPQDLEKVQEFEKLISQINGKN